SDDATVAMRDRFSRNEEACPFHYRNGSRPAVCRERFPSIAPGIARGEEANKQAWFKGGDRICDRRCRFKGFLFLHPPPSPPEMHSPPVEDPLIDDLLPQEIWDQEILAIHL